jgi:hypothetical protein
MCFVYRKKYYVLNCINVKEKRKRHRKTEREKKVERENVLSVYKERKYV